MQQWFDDYGVSHKNPTNKAIHWICVPLIFFSIIGLLASIPSGFMANNFPASIAPFVHFGSVLIFLGMSFFLRLSISISIGMFLVSAAMILGQYGIERLDIAPLWLINLIIFVAAWVGQFIGHNIEGEKPSFFQDLQFLLIGPAWLLHFIYRKLGIGI
jgi:uncharacterized membrane protein YGL010W